jgi:ligand-binding sensor domain-containing protein
MQGKNLLRTALLLLYISKGAVLFSQNSWQTFDSQNSDLPENTIRCLTIDHQHKKWIGTDGGLAVFNDTVWQIFNTNNSPLTSNSIRTLRVDKNNHIWIGTFNGGLYKFDQQGNWAGYNTSNSGISDDYIRAIAFDTLNNLWIGTTDGLNFFDGNNWTVFNTGNSALLSNNITTIQVGKNNQKFIGTINGGLVYYNDTTFTIYYNTTSNMPDNSALHIALDSNDFRWVATPSAGLVAHLNGSAWQVFHELNSGMPASSVNYVAIDKAQTKFLAMQQNGLVIFKNGQWTNLTSNNSPLPENFLLSLAIEKDSILWIGTLSHGLVKWNMYANSSINVIEPQKQCLNIVFANNTEISLGKMYESVEIHNLSGQLCVATKNTDRVSLNMFNNGVYIVVLKDKHQVCRSKILLNKH